MIEREVPKYEAFLGNDGNWWVKENILNGLTSKLVMHMNIPHDENGAKKWAEKANKFHW